MIDRLAIWHAPNESLSHKFVNVVRAGDSINTEFDALVALVINGRFEKDFLPAERTNPSTDLTGIGDLVEGLITKYRIPHGHSKKYKETRATPKD